MTDKQNIRKQVALKRIKHAKIAKTLTGLAIDSAFQDSIKLREKQDQEFKKFMFYTKLQEALDHLEETEDESK